jgi:hypothetical protein
MLTAHKRPANKDHQALHFAYSPHKCVFVYMGIVVCSVCTLENENWSPLCVCEDDYIFDIVNFYS